MFNLVNITKSLFLEQQDDSKLTLLRKSITERLPITINYKGPADEVVSGQRFDIEPIVLGKNAKSGNLVIWAYVFKGVSKKGLPGWKMFRVDRIENVKINLGINIDAFNILKSKVKNINGERVISSLDFEDAVRDLYRKKEDDWKNYQRMITGNVRPGEGTRKRFDNTSKEELGKLLIKNNIKITNNLQEPLSEMIIRIKSLIYF